MSNKQLAEVAFSYSQPIPWRTVDAGLCLEGRCLANNKYGRCKAYGQMVIGSLQTGQFTISSRFTFECPMCGNNVRAEKFGLNRCKWRLINTDKWSNVGDIYQTYNLSQLPIHIEIRSLDQNYDSIEEIQDCTICFSPMDKKNKCSILPCKHIFHMECIHRWIDADEETSFQCPICRTPIFE